MSQAGRRIGDVGAIGEPSGHVFRVERAHGPVWCAKYRLPGGHQVQKKIGPAWAERGRPPVGYFTKRTADAWLQDVWAQARQGCGAIRGNHLPEPKARALNVPVDDLPTLDPRPPAPGNQEPAGEIRVASEEQVREMVQM